jgi:hypothetical protein
VSLLHAVQLVGCAAPGWSILTGALQNVKCAMHMQQTLYMIVAAVSGQSANHTTGFCNRHATNTHGRQTLAHPCWACRSGSSRVLPGSWTGR